MALRTTSIVDLAAIKAFLRQQPATAVAVTSLTSVGTLATVAAAGHGLLSGQQTTIGGATQPEYNGTYVVTVTDVNHYTYVFGGSVTSPATGTIVSRGEDTSVDTILSEIGDGLSNWIEREVAGRVFQPRTFSEIQRGLGKAKLFVKKIPLLSVTSLTDNGSAIASSSYVIADPMLGMIELLDTTFSVGAGRIAVTYRAGYDNSNELLMFPADATLLCLELVKAAYAELTSGAITFQSITAGPATVSVRPGLNPRHQRMLNGLRDMRI